MSVLSDVYKLTTMAGDVGVRQASKVAMFALRDRIMRINDDRWERELQVDTGEPKEFDGLEILSEHKQFGFSYYPAPTPVFQFMMRNLAADLRTFTFIDFGSGEGRLVLSALHSGFRECIGIEFAKELHEAASRNIAQATKVTQKAARCRSYHLDATKFVVPHSACVCYFNNPFGEPVFARVLEQIAAAHVQSGKKMYVLYQQPALGLDTDRTDNVGLLRASPLFRERPLTYSGLWERFLLGSYELQIFETCHGSAA